MPTGALLGLDAVTAAVVGTIYSVRMITRKPPRGLAGAPYLVSNGISVSRASTDQSGSFVAARATRPPVFLPMSTWRPRFRSPGIGPDRTLMEIRADLDTTDRNCHTIEVDSDCARFTLSIENVPSENPKNGTDHGAVGAGGPAQARVAYASWEF